LLFIFWVLSLNTIDAIFCASGRNGEPCPLNSHMKMAAPTQAAYTNFPQQDGDNFQLKSPINVPSMIMDDDVLVRDSLFLA